MHDLLPSRLVAPKETTAKGVQQKVHVEKCHYAVNPQGVRQIGQESTNEHGEKLGYF